MENVYSPIEDKKMEDLHLPINDIVSSLSQNFTTHQLILQLAKNNQRAYVKALHELDSDRPFQSLHSKIGKYLSASTNLVRFVQNKVDVDIFGQPSENAEWERLV